MSPVEARIIAQAVVVRVVMRKLRKRPALLQALQIAALDAAHEYNSVLVMQELCKVLELRG